MFESLTGAQLGRSLLALLVVVAPGARSQTRHPAVARVVKLTNIETSYPHWSPDGRRLVYQSNRSGNSEIYIMNADGTGVAQLTHHPATDENPSWSPDGSHIAFRSYRDGNAEIYLMSIDGSGLTNLTNHPSDDIHPYWSRDGSRILFNSNRSRDSSGAPVQTIYSMARDGRDVRQVSRVPVEETYAQWSPDGSQIVFRRRLPEETPGWERNPGNSEIYVMRADGSNPTRLTTHPGFDGWPSWSPDGAWIAFASEGSGEFQIHLIRPDGTGQRRLTEGPGSFTKPIFSPDGRRIVCTRTLDGNVEIFVVELSAEAAGTTSSTAERLLRAATDAMGGEAVLAGLPTLTTSYHLIERGLGQEQWPGGSAPVSVQTGERVVSATGRRERLTMKRHMSGGRVYDRVLDAGPWRPRGLPVVRFPGQERALSAALTTMHPEVLLPLLRRQASLSATLDRTRLIAGREARGVKVRLENEPLSLFFSDVDSTLLAVEFIDHDLSPVDDDAVLVVFSEYRRAEAVPGEPRMPHLIEVYRGGQLWQARSYAEYRPGGTVDAPVPPIGVAQVDTVPVTPDVLHLRGSEFNSLLVDVGDRVVLMELPEPDRAAAVLAVARRRAQNRPVSVVVTHFHEDHIAGLVEARGIEFITHERLVAPLREMLTRLRPGVAPTIRGVHDRLSLGAGGRELQLLAPRHSHADGMLVGYVAPARLLFEVDLVRGLLPHSTYEFVRWVRETGLNVNTVLSSHGGATPWERVAAAADTWKAQLNVHPR